MICICGTIPELKQNKNKRYYIECPKCKRCAGFYKSVKVTKMAWNLLQSITRRQK